MKCGIEPESCQLLNPWRIHEYWRNQWGFAAKNDRMVIYFRVILYCKL